jgi:hypothetical protein
MSELTTKSVLHSRLSGFTKWIAPDPDKMEDIYDRGDEIRKNIKQEAEDDKLVVQSTPIGGSSGKGTGIRRHYRGKSEVDGMDIDIPVVVEPITTSGDQLQELLVKFEGYARAAYPTTNIDKTKSSIKLMFADKVTFDLVPMLATDKDYEQVLIRRNGDRLRTSVQKHNEFIKSRTKVSKGTPGLVSFNNGIRLMKWWKEFQADSSYYLGYNKMSDINNIPPTILIDLLCAHTFDKLGVEKTYAETLAKWCSYLSHVVRNKKAVHFSDYYSNPTLSTNALWIVLDPVNCENNIVASWNDNKINELATWFETARDNWQRIIHYDEDGSDTLALSELVKLFGNPFKNHCDND